MCPSRSASLRGLDGRFLLPDWPRSLRLVGDVPGWGDALAAGHFTAGADAATDLVVAPAAMAASAVIRRPGAVMLNGRPPRGEWQTGYDLERLLALPDTLDPRVLVPRAHRRAAAFVLTSWLPGRSRLSRLRNTCGAGLARAGLLPPVVPEICMATASASPPAILAAAAAEHLVPTLDGAQWFLGAESGGDSKRLGLFLFPGVARTPTHLLKLDRRPGRTESAGRESAGLELVRSVGGAVQARAPQLLGRFDFHGHDVLVQTVCPGTTLARVLLGPFSLREKAAVVEQVVTWLRQVARETVLQVPTETTSEPGRGPAGRTVPRVFGHGDLAPGNILVAGGGFSVVDWEHADRTTPPLRDLLFFALHTLPLLDGNDEEPDDEYLLRLFCGQAPASARLFAWVHRLRGDLSLTDEEVSALAQSCWAHYADLVSQLRQAVVRGGGTTFPPLPVERLARLWDEDPRLRGSWLAWREPDVRPSAA